MVFHWCARFWTAPSLTTVPNGFNARHKFSLKTCNGCHARETSTNFTHVGPTGALSNFLATGMASMTTPYNVTDPVSGAVLVAAGEPQLIS